MPMLELLRTSIARSATVEIDRTITPIAVTLLSRNTIVLYPAIIVHVKASGAAMLPRASREECRTSRLNCVTFDRTNNIELLPVECMPHVARLLSIRIEKFVAATVWISAMNTSVAFELDSTYCTFDTFTRKSMTNKDGPGVGAVTMQSQSVTEMLLIR